MGSLLVSGSMWDTRLLVYVLDNSRATQDTMNTLDKWCAWSLTELQLGHFFDIDPYGRPFPAYEKGRKGHVAGGWRAVLVFHKGDEKYIQRCYRTSHSAVGKHVCTLCLATNDQSDLVYTTHGVNAKHRTTMLSTSDFITKVSGTTTFVAIPGWNVKVLSFDWLHVVDLTVIPETAASCLVELCNASVFGHAGTADERLRKAYVCFIRACKRAGIRSRGQMFSM